MPKKNVPVNFISRDFQSIKKDLLEYAKKYYPNTYKDFSDAGFGSLMIDSVSYIGDILSFYLDYQANETFIQNASEFNNILKLAKQMGYKFRNNPSSSTIASFYVLVPANATGTAPNDSYIPVLKQGSVFSSEGGGTFLLDEDVNFQNAEVVVSRVNETTGAPTYYALKSYGRIVSGELKTTTSTVGDFERFRKIKLDLANVTEVLSVVDSDGHEYYEVDFLSQNTVYKAITNRDSTTQTQANMLLKPIIAPRRFSMDVFPDYIEMQFGSGREEDYETEQEINPKNVAMSMNGRPYITEQALDPSKLIKSEHYGTSPSNTVLNITYRQNSATNVNASTNTVNRVVDGVVEFTDEANLDFTLVNVVRNSLEITNEDPIVGDTEDIDSEELRNRVLNNFSSQYRAVTKEDYVALAYSMPAKFGSVVRAAVMRDKDSARRNMNMYVVGVDSDNKLTACNNVTKQNLKTWLSRNKMINDSLDILDAQVMNVGIKFEIVAQDQSMSIETLERCLIALEERYGDTFADIGEDLFISDIYDLLNSVPGVVDAVNVRIVPKTGLNYSSVAIDLEKNISSDGRYIVMPKNVVYEVKYPSLDIQGAVR